jgi:hypothetical protein
VLAGDQFPTHFAANVSEDADCIVTVECIALPGCRVQARGLRDGLNGIAEAIQAWYLEHKSEPGLHAVVPTDAAEFAPIDTVAERGVCPAESFEPTYAKCSQPVGHAGRHFDELVGAAFTHATARIQLPGPVGTAEPETSLALHEPWSWRQEDAVCLITGADGLTVADTFFNEMPSVNENIYARRIAACVNALAGMATHLIEELKPGDVASALSAAVHVPPFDFVIMNALVRAERKLSAYVGVCTGDKELTDAILPMVRTAIEKIEGKR